ncbi:hypothetical protein Ancab_028289 [Ancistrocladus abbreviatus]
MAELLSNKPLFDGKTEIDQLAQWDFEAKRYGDETPALKCEIPNTQAQTSEPP